MSSCFQNPEISAMEAVKGWLLKFRIGDSVGDDSLGYELESVGPKRCGRNRLEASVEGTRRDRA